ncbi:hypothetical protein K491DRAFT_256114 [Lophiostoma macrostomum CBS 122681]|uniref:Uncharacterized protein n=1 Tax=Lophiostoma macrostomum CBS 122681 TaxID=1314788 RepID=A0A6A6SMK1_9PLEO|nr:hypothetical protein K491DRAFT_256114 [Lophiostoma macrostomum CBS 122681]
MSAEPLVSTPEDSEVQPKRSMGQHNPDETYARYERSPFRNYTLKPNQNQHDGVNRQPSKSSFMDRINSVRDRFASNSQRGRQVSKKRTNGKNKDSGGRPRPDYSLAGPSPNSKEDDDYESADSEDGFGDYGRRPQAKIGLAQPFPRGKRNDRWRKSYKKDKSKNKDGSRTGPDSESGRPEGQVSWTRLGHISCPLTPIP